MAKQREIFGLDPKLFLGLVIVGAVTMVVALFSSFAADQRSQIRFLLEENKRMKAALEENEGRIRGLEVQIDQVRCELRGWEFDFNTLTCRRPPGLRSQNE